jgi:hypothetical protein
MSLAALALQPFGKPYVDLCGLSLPASFTGKWLRRYFFDGRCQLRLRREANSRRSIVRKSTGRKGVGDGRPLTE